MIRHVVMFKFKEETDKKARQEFVDTLHRLLDDIEVVRRLEVGKNFTDSPRTCDIVLLVDVDNEAALKIYADHPKHQPVKQRAGEICEASYVVDYLAAH